MVPKIHSSKDWPKNFWNSDIFPKLLTSPLPRPLLFQLIWDIFKGISIVSLFISINRANTEYKLDVPVFSTFTIIKCFIMSSGDVHWWGEGAVSLRERSPPGSDVSFCCSLRPCTGRFITELSGISKIWRIYVHISYSTRSNAPISLVWVYLLVSWHPDIKDIPESSHGRVFCEKFHCVFGERCLKLAHWPNIQQKRNLCFKFYIIRLWK